MDSARPVDRRYDLDALRVLAVLLLIVFHSARVFDVFDPFYVKNPETSDPFSWAVVAFLNPWHMPLLFVLAGAATWLALGHRGAADGRCPEGRAGPPAYQGRPGVPAPAGDRQPARLQR